MKYLVHDRGMKRKLLSALILVLFPLFAIHAAGSQEAAPAESAPAPEPAAVEVEEDWDLTTPEGMEELGHLRESFLPTERSHTKNGG